MDGALQQQACVGAYPATILQALTEDIHSKEALELVKEHVMGILGQANMSYNNAMIKMSKLQGAQVGTAYRDMLQLLQLGSMHMSWTAR